jgi:hypothetical protein
MRIRQARSSPNAKRSGAPTTGSGVLSSPSRRSGPAFASTLLDAAERSRCNQSVLDPASITRTSLPSCPRINSALGTPARSRRASSGWMRLRRRRAGIARRGCRIMQRRNISARIAAKARESGRRRHPLARDRIAASRLVRKPFVCWTRGLAVAPRRECLAICNSGPHTNQGWPSLNVLWITASRPV